MRARAAVPPLLLSDGYKVAGVVRGAMAVVTGLLTRSAATKAVAPKALPTRALEATVAAMLLVPSVASIASLVPVSSFYRYNPPSFQYTHHSSFPKFVHLLPLLRGEVWPHSYSEPCFHTTLPIKVIQ